MKSLSQINGLLLLIGLIDKIQVPVRNSFLEFFTVQLNKYQASVVAYLFDMLPIGEEVDTLNFSLSGDFIGKFNAAYSKIKEQTAEIYIVFNIPSYSRSVFLALSKSNPKITARLLANIEDYERESEVELGFGDVVVLADQAGQDKNTPFAVILLRTATAIDIKNIPDNLAIKDKETLFFLAVPLAENEYNLWRQQGHDALMDLFISDNKELFF